MRALVLVDLQNDFIDGSLGTAEAQAIVPNAVKKIQGIDDNETVVVFTKDTHGKDYMDTLEGTMLPIEHCIENTHGWSINKEISEAVKSNPAVKTWSSGKIIKSRIYKNTFGSDTLVNFLRCLGDSLDKVEFCGLCTDICVVSNVLMTRQALPDTQIIVDADCCAGTTPERHLAALEVMKSCQIDVRGEEL